MRLSSDGGEESTVESLDLSSPGASGYTGSLLDVSIFPRKLNHIIRPLALALALQQEPLRVPLYLHHL